MPSKLKYIYILSRSPHLQDVFPLPAFPDLTDDGIEVLALEFSGIVKLDLSGCSRITDESMDSIARHSQHMRWLKICNCPQVSDLAIEMLKERYPHLTVVLSSDVDEETGKNVDSIF